jgi:hypothetical protein
VASFPGYKLIVDLQTSRSVANADRSVVFGFEMLTPFRKALPGQWPGTRSA